VGLESDTGYYVVLASRAFTRVAEARLRPLGLGAAHMPVLLALTEHGSLTQKELARITQVKQPTAAALLHRMEAAGLVVRTPDSRDGRATLVSLTERGTSLLPVALDQRRQAIDAATAGLSPQEVETLNLLLAHVLVNLWGLVNGSDDGQPAP
jgi:MarR family transcriptional regulator for hemolysin